MKRIKIPSRRKKPSPPPVEWDPQTLEKYKFLKENVEGYTPNLVFNKNIGRWILKVED